jgi:phosphate transport system protein
VGAANNPFLELLTMNDRGEGHTFKRFDGQLSNLHLMVTKMGQSVHQQVQDALTAFRTQDIALAQKVLARHSDIDRMELAADAEIVEVIARNSPLASDLRLVVAVSKSVGDLQKIGEEATRMALLLEEIRLESSTPLIESLMDGVDRMGVLVLSHLDTAVGLFDQWDEQKALYVIAGHQRMDGDFQAELHRVMTCLLEESLDVKAAVRLVLLAKSLDRIIHHALNLAEYAMFEIYGGK